MLQYDEAVEVHRGTTDAAAAPDQFLWRGRLWRVCAVVARWVETAAWWQPMEPAGRSEPGGGVTPGGVTPGGGADGWGPERTVFRVEAGSGRHGRRETFDLAFDAVSGRWQLERVTGR